jgi:hypothetical protein
VKSLAIFANLKIRGNPPDRQNSATSKRASEGIAAEAFEHEIILRIP